MPLSRLISEYLKPSFVSNGSCFAFAMFFFVWFGQSITYYYAIEITNAENRRVALMGLLDCRCWSGWSVYMVYSVTSPMDCSQYCSIPEYLWPVRNSSDWSENSLVKLDWWNWKKKKTFEVVRKIVQKKNNRTNQNGWLSIFTCNLDWMANTGAMMGCNLMDLRANTLDSRENNLKFCIINIGSNEWFLDQKKYDRCISNSI